MPVTRRRVTTAAEMRALSHPVRLDLLELLATHGPLTASEAGLLLDQTPSNMSWHFRKLAEHGFVRQTQGRGRLRPWKIVAESLSWGDDAADPVAASALYDIALDREFQGLRRALANAESETHEWRDSMQVYQSKLWLTAEEAAELGRRLGELLNSYRDRSTEPELRPPNARLTALMAWVVPDGPPLGSPIPHPSVEVEKASR
jgi:DNA-binding transcriptional ArsR family regulator